MFATAVVISLGAGAGSVLPIPSACGNRVATSFAKSFDEVATGLKLGQGMVRPAQTPPVMGNAQSSNILNVADGKMIDVGDEPAPVQLDTLLRVGMPVQEEMYEKQRLSAPTVASTDSAELHASIGNSCVLRDGEKISTADSRKSLDATGGELNDLKVKKTRSDVDAPSDSALVDKIEIAVEAPSEPPRPAPKLGKAEGLIPTQSGAKEVSAKPLPAEMCARLETNKRPVVDGKAQVEVPARREAKYKERAVGSGDAAKDAVVPTTAAATEAPGSIATPVNVAAPVAVRRNDMGETFDGRSSLVAPGLPPTRSTGTTSGTNDTGRISRSHVGSDSATNTAGVVSAVSVRPHHTNFPIISTTQEDATSQMRSRVSDSVKAERSAPAALGDGIGTTDRVSAPAVTPVVHGMANGLGPMARDESAPKIQAIDVSSSAPRSGDRASLTELGTTGSEVQKTLSATPTMLEVGVASGTHGWLKIRAEMTDGGVVNASLSATSSSGQEMLHRELPSLTAFMQSEGVGVNVIAMDSTARMTGTSDFGGNMSGGEGNGQSQQSSGQGGDGQHGMAGLISDEAMSYDGRSLVSGAEWVSPVVYTGGGSWLSVRA
jgi:hypothetical protein